MAEYGIRKGLAVDLGFNQGVADIARQNDQMRQAKLYAENQAKMQAEDFDYNNAMNAWDNTQVKEFAQGKIKELGAFIRDNPDYKYNLEKRIIYNNIKKELKDNKPLLEGMQVDANVKAMQAYMNDPKNAPLVQSEEFSPIKAQYENYLKTGSTDGNLANRKLFTFTPPEELVDLTPYAQKYASSIARNGKEEKKWNGVGTIRQYAKEDDKIAAVNSAMNDPVAGKHWKRKYNHYLSTIPEGEKPISFEQMVYRDFQPFVKEDEYKTYNYSTGAGKGSAKGNDAPALSPYKSVYERAFTAYAQNGKSTPVAASVDGMRRVVAGKGDLMNTAGKFFRTTSGEMIPLNSFSTSNFTTSGTNVFFDKNYGLMGTVQMSVPLDEFNNTLKSTKPIEAVNTNWFSPDEMTENYKNVQIKENDEGKKIAVFDVMVPLEGSNESVALPYDVGVGTKAQEADSGQEPLMPASAPKKGENGVTYTLWNDGYVRGSDGSVKQMK